MDQEAERTLRRIVRLEVIPRIREVLTLRLVRRTSVVATLGRGSNDGAARVSAVSVQLACSLDIGVISVRTVSFDAGMTWARGRFVAVR